MEKKKEKATFTMSPAPSNITLNMSSTITLTEKMPDGDEYNPFEHRETSNQYSNLGALAHLLKGSLGSGILAMPTAFKNGGLVFGFFGTIVIGIVCTHCVHLLVNSAQALCRRLRVPSLGFAETAEAAFATGPEALRPYSHLARNFVSTALFCTYYFGLTAYVIFIAASIQQIVTFYAGEPDMEPLLYKRIFIAVLFVVIAPISLIKKLKQLVPLSMVANLCIVVGFAILLYYMFTDLPSPSERNYSTSLKGLPIFFATVLFAMEGIGTIMPVENTMKNPERMGGWTGILNIAMAVVVMLFTIIGFVGYLKYGEDVEGSITLNLPSSEIPAQIVKLALAVTILFTYPLQLYVPCEMLWNVISPKIRTSMYTTAQNVMRIVLVAGSVILALAVPNLSPVISLVGALFFSILGLFIPATVDIVTRLNGDRIGFWLGLILFKNGLLIVLSLFSIVAGSYASILDIIEEYSGSES